MWKRFARAAGMGRRLLSEAPKPAASEQVATRAVESPYAVYKSAALVALVAAGGGAVYMNQDVMFAGVMKKMLAKVADPEAFSATRTSALYGLFGLMGIDDETQYFLQLTAELGGIDKLIEASNVLLKSNAEEDKETLKIVWSLLELMSRLSANSDRFAANSEALDAVFAALDDPNLRPGAWGVVMFSAMNPSCKLPLLERGVLARIQVLAEGKSAAELDPESTQKMTFTLVNLVNKFPLNYKSSMTSQQRQILLNAGVNVANHFTQQGNIYPAVMLLEDLRQFAAEEPVVHLTTGLTYNQLGNHAKANECFREVLRLHPGIMEARAYLSQNLISHGGVAGKEEAVKLLVQGLSTHKFSKAVSELYFMLSSTLESLGRHKEAARYLENLLKVQPRNSRALIKLGRLSLSMNNNKRALQVLMRAHGLQKFDAATLYYLGVAYEKTGNAVEAKAKLQQAINLNPLIGSGMAKYYLGKLSMKEKNYSEAGTYFDEASEAYTAPEAYYHSGVAWHHAGIPERASEGFSKTLDAWRRMSLRQGCSVREYLTTHPGDMKAYTKIKSVCSEAGYESLALSVETFTEIFNQ